MTSGAPPFREEAEAVAVIGFPLALFIIARRGLDLGGTPFGEPTTFTIGVGVNPGHLDLDYELRVSNGK